MEKVNLNRFQKHSIWVNLFLALLLLFLLSSCGARKVQKSDTKVSEQTEVIATKLDTSKTVTNTNTNIVEVDSTDEVLITPADTSKVMLVNGHTYKNVVLKRIKTHKSKTDLSVTTKTENKAVSEAINEKHNKTIEVVKKDITAFHFNWWWLLLLLLIPLGYLVYKYRYIWV